MLPIVLVLLVATSVLAAPGVNIYPRDRNEVVPPKHNGRPVSAFLIDQALEVYDAGSLSTYVVTVNNVMTDLANLPDRNSQALALAELISVLGSVANGIPGDACTAAYLIDAYVFALQTGNFDKVRVAIPKYIQSLSSSIDLIVQLASNPNSLRFASGSRGNCANGGRVYQFEAAWDAILSNATPISARLVNEQYCSAKRLYDTHNVLNNNVGAAVTASSLPPINRIFQTALDPVARFVQAIALGRPAAAAAGAAKAALARAAATVDL